jgi:hypothetical protein
MDCRRCADALLLLLNFMLCYFLFGNSPILFVSHAYVCLQMGILVITVDLDCCRCRAKITKVLDSLKGTF